MADKLRGIEFSDFEKIELLFQGRKDESELRWLFRNPSIPEGYQGIVAVDDESNIVGVIGYSNLRYRDNGNLPTGSIFMSWRVSENYSGFAGISLLKKASNQGDFGIAIAGSEQGKKFYSMLKYQYVSESIIFYKILNLPHIFKSVKRRTIIKKIGTIGLLLPSFYKNSGRKTQQNNICFTRYDGSNFFEEKQFNEVISKIMSKDYLEWLLSCPKVESFAFSIKKNDLELGMCVLYKYDFDEVSKGRIVHLPFLGSEISLWTSVISKCITFLRDKGCVIVDAMASHEVPRKALLKSGFVTLPGHTKPNYIKDTKGVFHSVTKENWNFQYSEGDKGYRNF